MSRTIRSLTALLSVLAVTSTAGCAAGLGDVTSHERSTPYVAKVDAGQLHIRDVFVTVDGTTPKSGFLSLVIVNDGGQADTLTGVQVGDGTVVPTDPTLVPTVASNHTLAFIDPQSGATVSGTSGGGLAIRNLSQPLVAGTSVQVTLAFSTAGQVTVSAPVLSAPGS